MSHTQICKVGFIYPKELPARVIKRELAGRLTEWILKEVPIQISDIDRFGEAYSEAKVEFYFEPKGPDDKP